MLNKRIAEINKRRAEIRTALETDQNADIDALEQELRGLNDELTKIERRRSIASGINVGTIAGTQIPNPTTEQGAPEARTFDRETVLSTKEYRSAWAKTLMGRKLSEVEKRAMDTALTTTSTTFSAPTSSADGVNNGGLFIPSDINLALLEAVSQVSPIYRDVAKTDIPGVVKFPYKKSATGAKSVGEKDASPDGSIEWADLELGISEIAETIPVSWRLEAMAVDAFIDYIQSELIEQVKDKLATDLIYGTGNNQMRGVTLDAIQHTYTGSVLDGINAALGKLDSKLKVGAKLYVSQSIVEDISFTKDNNGNYIYSPINSTGVKSIATYPAEVDPYLKAGDFVLGNLRRHYRMNTIEAMSLTKDSSGKKRRNEYTAYELVGGACQPNTVVYGKKTTA